MERIHIEDRSRNFDPVDAATNGGFIHSHFAKASAGVQLHDSIVSNMAEARRRAAWLGTDLKICLKWRPDIMDTKATYHYNADGFNPDWILGNVSFGNASETMLDWHRNGWNLRVNPSHLEDEGWQQYVDASNGRPHLYFYTENKTVNFYNLVCDLRNPEYRAYCVENAVEWCDTYQFDTFQLGTKAGWYMNGSPSRSTATSNPHYGGLFYKSTYGPGEFESAMNMLINDLAIKSIHCVLVHRPPRPKDQLRGDVWDYISPSNQEYSLGEYI